MIFDRKKQKQSRIAEENTWEIAINPREMSIKKKKKIT